MISPFIEFEFMRRALLGCLLLCLSATPVGVFLLLRRMSLTSDAMSHAILPGAAIGFLVAGISVFAMTIGGLIAGLLVALIAGVISRYTRLNEDASLAALYLISLAVGVLIISQKGSNMDLLHILFGTPLALNNDALYLLAGAASVSVVLLNLIYRPLVMECVDPGYLKVVSRLGPWVHSAFLLLVVLNLVAGFHALGTLMAVALMILPAVAARFWTQNLLSFIALSVLFAMLACYGGLLLSYYLGWATSSAIVLTLGLFYLGSLFTGPFGGLLTQLNLSLRAPK